jgi:predicted RNA polymerase sigma factor
VDDQLRASGNADQLSAVTAATHRAINAVWRIDSARIIASLARMVRDVGLAEELAQDALVTALERWPESGVPDKPGAWLMAAAKHRALASLTRNARERELLQERAAACAREAASRTTVGAVDSPQK